MPKLRNPTTSCAEMWDFYEMMCRNGARTQATSTYDICRTFRKLGEKIASSQRLAWSMSLSIVESNFSRLMLLCHNFLLACRGLATLCGLSTSSVTMFSWCLCLLSLTTSVISWVTNSHCGAVASTLSLEMLSPAVVWKTEPPQKKD